MKIIARIGVILIGLAGIAALAIFITGHVQERSERNAFELKHTEIRALAEKVAERADAGEMGITSLFEYKHVSEHTIEGQAHQARHGEILSETAFNQI